MKVRQIQLIAFLLLFISCQKLERNNPFDPISQKGRWTPANFQAQQSPYGIELSWYSQEKNISGFKLSRQVDGGITTTLATLIKDSIHYVDRNMVLGKAHNYFLVAYAGNNESNPVQVISNPIIVVTTNPPSSITTVSAVLGGIINASNGTIIVDRGIVFRKDNSGGSGYSLGAGIPGIFNITVPSLLPNTKYYYYAWANTNQNVRVQGVELSLTTLPLSVATLNTSVPTNVFSSSATLGGNVTSDGGLVITENGVVYSTIQNPTNSNNKMAIGSGINAYQKNITNLTPNTTYYVRAYAINGQGIAYGNQISFTTTPKTVNTGKVMDIEGNTYKTVTIGTQAWMAENLKTTKYRDGSQIPNVIDNVAWYSLTNGAYCWCKNLASNKDTYGALYNYFTVISGKLCPVGWHVPSDEDFNILISFLGGESVAGGKLKETGTLHWLSPNSYATNSSGFTALPGGARTVNEFLYFGNSAGFWSSTEVYSETAWTCWLTNSSNGFSKYNNSDKHDGYSIRCVGD